MTLDIQDAAARFRAIPTGHICDALEHEGIRTPVLPASLSPITASVHFAGPVTTLKLALCRTGKEPRRLQDLKAAVTPGSVVLIDGQGILDSVLFGDRAATGAIRNGAVAAVVNGAVRDVDGLRELDFPVFALSTGVPASEGRFMGVGLNVEVIIGGVLIEPGDWLVGDLSGICVIPHAMVERVLELAEERDQIDKESIVELKSGASFQKAHRHFRDDDPEHLRQVE